VWTARPPARFQKEAPHIVREADGRDTWIFGTNKPIVPVGVTRAGFHDGAQALVWFRAHVPPTSRSAKLDG
jgi:hypothetical protein